MAIDPTAPDRSPPIPGGPPHGRGCAVVTDLNGRILRIVTDELGIAEPPRSTTWLPDLVAASGREQIEAMVEAARSGTPTFDRRIIAPVDAMIETLHFAAYRRAEEILVSAAESRLALARVHDTLLDQLGVPIDAPPRATLGAWRDQARDADRTDALAVDVVRLEDRLAELKREIARAREVLQRSDAGAAPGPGNPPDPPSADDAD